MIVASDAAAVDATARHPNQEFSFERLDDGYYRIRVRHSGKVVDIAQASTDDGDPLIQYDWKGTDNQWFAVDDVGGSFVISAKHSGRVRDVARASLATAARISSGSSSGRRNGSMTTRRCGGLAAVAIQPAVGYGRGEPPRKRKG
jgi:hypothetical protein